MKLLGFKLHRWNFLVAQFATVKYNEQIQTTIAMAVQQSAKPS